METFILYKIFFETKSLLENLELLKCNGFKYQLENIEYDGNEIIGILTTEAILKIRMRDLEKIQKLNTLYKETVSANQYILFLEDAEIMKIVLNSSEYPIEKVDIAKKVYVIRNIKIPMKQLYSLKSNKGETNKTVDSDKIIKKGSSWFLWIAILSVLDIISIIFKQDVQFIVGLTYNYVILGVMDGIYRATGTNMMGLGFVLCFFLAGLFFWIWYKSKNYYKKTYLAGIIIYGIDALLPLLTKQWFHFAFHVLALWMLFLGYKQLKNRNRQKVEDEKEVNI